MKNEIDNELIANIALEISDRHKLILTIFPEDKEVLLKHLASSSIHLALFMKELIKDNPNKINSLDWAVEKFLATCGCKEYFK